MASLPDFQTTLITTLAYFDVGVAIKKSDLLALFESFTEYDNGVEGILSFGYGGGARTSVGTRVSIRVRARTDGLVYAWGLRSDENGIGTQFDSVASPGAMPFVRALLPVCPLNEGGPATRDTIPYRALLELANAITTPGRIVPTVETVSYYDFEFTGTGNIYVFGDDAFASGNGSVVVDPWQFTQPPGVTIFVLAAQVGARLLENGGSNQSASATMRLNGATLLSRGTGAIVSLVMWSSRTGASIMNALTPVGAQNNAEIEATCSGSNISRARVNGALVVYASG